MSTALATVIDYSPTISQQAAIAGKKLTKDIPYKSKRIHGEHSTVSRLFFGMSAKFLN